MTVSCIVTSTVLLLLAVCCIGLVLSCDIADCLWPSTVQLQYGLIWPSTILRLCMLPLLHRPCSALRWCGLPLAEYCPAAVRAVSGRVLSCDCACCLCYIGLVLSCDSGGSLWPSTAQLQYGLPLAEYYPATVDAASASSGLYCPAMVRAASGRVLPSCSAGCLWPSTAQLQCGLPLAEYYSATVHAASATSAT